MHYSGAMMESQAWKNNLKYRDIEVIIDFFEDSDDGMVSDESESEDKLEISAAAVLGES